MFSCLPLQGVGKGLAVGVDYMLGQILFARKHEVLMSMSEKSQLWGKSTHATVAAEIHKDYVDLLNIFCKIQDKADKESEWAGDLEILEERVRSESVARLEAEEKLRGKSTASTGIENDEDYMNAMAPPMPEGGIEMGSIFSGKSKIEKQLTGIVDDEEDFVPGVGLKGVNPMHAAKPHSSFGSRNSGN